METFFKRARKSNVHLFLGTGILVLFFIVAVRFSILIASKLEGEPMPEIAAGEWLIRSGDAVRGMPGVVDLIFFWKPDVAVSSEILKWGVEWDKSYRADGLRIIAIATPSVDVDTEELKKFLLSHGVRYDVALDAGGKNRKRFLHRSYATLYIADRFGIIRLVGDATMGKEEVENEILKLLDAIENPAIVFPRR